MDSMVGCIWRPGSLVNEGDGNVQGCCVRLRAHVDGRTQGRGGRPGGPRRHTFIRRLSVVRPALPDFLREVTLRGLRVGQARVNLAWRRRGKETLVEVVAQQGELLVETS